MDESLARAIARLVDRGFDLETLTPEGYATVRRGEELVELRIQEGQVFLRGDVPRDLLPATGGSHQRARSVDTEDEASTIHAPGMSAGAGPERRIGLTDPPVRAGHRARRRWSRRWWFWFLAFVLIATAAGGAAIVAFEMLDQPLPDILQDIRSAIQAYLQLSPSALAGTLRMMPRAR